MRLRTKHLLLATVTLTLATAPAKAQTTCVDEVEEMVEAVRADEAWQQIEREFSDMAGDASVLAMKGDDENCYAALADMRRYLIDRDIIVADVSDPPRVEADRPVGETADAVPAVPERAGDSRGAPLAEVTEQPALPVAPSNGAPVKEMERGAVSGDDANVTVQRSQADVRVVPSEPSVSVVERDASVSVVQPEPNVRVIQPDPSVTVVQPEPSVDIQDPKDVSADPETADSDIAVVSAANLSAILVREVEFGFDKASITSEAREVLQDIAELAAENSEAPLLLTGHTDSVGPASYNLELSKRRVAAVVEALASLGIDRDRIQTRHFGERRPEVQSPESERAPHNRRVEIRLLEPSA